jgi:hypothetical protein
MDTEEKSFITYRTYQQLNKFEEPLAHNVMHEETKGSFESIFVKYRERRYLLRKWPR